MSYTEIIGEVLLLYISKMELNYATYYYDYCKVEGIFNESKNVLTESGSV